MSLHTLQPYILERTFLPRRYGIGLGKSFLYGPPKSGKTSLALQFTLGFKNAIYIDLADRRLKNQEVQGYLLKMHLEKKADVLVLDNYDTSITLPNISNIVLIGHKEHCPKDFVSKCILPLCFEEFVTFDTKNLSFKSLFDMFLKNGNLPEMQEIPQYKRLQRLYEIVCLAFGSDKEIFLQLLVFQSQNIAPHRIYTSLKKIMKVSKDRIYALLAHWQEEGVIFFLPHSTRANTKKLYFADFSLSHLIGHKPMAQLENMLFLELIKISNNKEKLQLGNGGEFVYNDCAYVSIPFATLELIIQKLKKIVYKRVFIITLSFEGRGIIDGKQWYALKFVDFALGEYNI